MIDPHSFIAVKRDGSSHRSGEIAGFVEALVSGAVEPCQASAWLMAAFLRGLDESETLELTLAMRDSGRILAWPDDPRPLSDKHSTGGVGDKISLVLAPLAAAAGL
ncbi:thymidine phosphorylase, partial [Candidatus Fermentibacteria bacterium]|nr:thymidine phosphorylase [Candidatus Fermentibacteria bacterium]